MTEKKETERRIENNLLIIFMLVLVQFTCATHTFQLNHYFAMSQISEYLALAVAVVFKFKASVSIHITLFWKGLSFEGLGLDQVAKQQKHLKYSLTI